MVQKTDLNVAPYYDDFASSNNFVRTLFRPGFAVQARELTQLQTILQDQVEKHGNHIFEEGAMVLPGQISFNKDYHTLKLNSTFDDVTIDPSQYYNADSNIVIMGTTTGVQARVIGYSVGSTTEQPILHIRYVASGTDGSTSVFADNEDIVATAAIVHTSTYSVATAVANGATTITTLEVDGNTGTITDSMYVIGEGIRGAVSVTVTDQNNLVLSSAQNIPDNVTLTFCIPSTKTFTATSTTATDPYGPASATGCSANIQPGVYYLRGIFVENTEQLVVIDKYNNKVGARIGWTITETLITPEGDATLTDNATGSNNYAAKGAHRLQLGLTLSSLSLTSTTDLNFVHLMEIRNGVVQSAVRATKYAEIEDTFARRTLDESGNYTVRPFQIVSHESVDVDKEDGLYTLGATTDDSNTASEDMFALKISPGKAYINGYEIEKIAPSIKDVNKARDTNLVTGGLTAWEIGNYTTITNIHGLPDITLDSAGAAAIFGQLEFTDAPTPNAAGRGTRTGDVIGVGRARLMQYHSGNRAHTDATYDATLAGGQYKLYMFDIKPYTKLTVAGGGNHTITPTLAIGDFVTGTSSGATGYVAVASTASTLYLTSVVGAFSTSDNLTATSSAVNLIDNTSAVTVSAIRTYSFADFKQVFNDNTGGTAAINFTADLVLADTFQLSGSIRMASGAAAVVGTGTSFSSQLVDGDNITIQGAAAGPIDFETTVNGTPSSDVAFNAAANAGATVQGAIIIRKRAKLFDTEKNVGLLKLPKDFISTASTFQYSVRRQHHSLTSSSATVSLPQLPATEAYDADTAADYILAIDNDDSADTKNGDIGDPTVTLSNGNRDVTFSGVSGLADPDTCRAIASITRTSSASNITKTKTTRLSQPLKVDSTSTSAYGTNSSDSTISLGRPDAFKLQAVYDSERNDQNANPPYFTAAAGTANSGKAFTQGEVIKGGSSGAKARFVSLDTNYYYVLTTTINFQVGETITGLTSGAYGVVTTVVAGSSVITSNFTLDTGQRDNYYDIARIVRKSNAPAPTGKLLVIYDYLEHSSTGDFFTVDSYTDVANQMDYKDIPKYSATKVDPDERAPTGQYKLTDCFDFRPSVTSIAGATATGGVTFVQTLAATSGTYDEVTANSFDFASRGYDGATASSLNFPKPASNITSTFNYYLPKKALVFMDKDGAITIKEGTSAESPQLPKPADESMLLATLHIPSYTFFPNDVRIIKEKNQRFTMKDIGKLKNRVENIEYYTALSLLERDAESFEIQDASGLNRFKSGFIVDNFAGHSVGDVEHQDYKISIDMEAHELRPKHKTQMIDLEENISTDSARTSVHYQKTGDLLTLPYTEVEYTKQPYATTCEKVNPLLSSTWLGKIELSPATDSWFETEIAPRLVINVEGNYDTFFAANEDKLGTVWNSWQTGWAGVVDATNVAGAPAGFRRIIETVRTDHNRSGLLTEVIARYDEESEGFRKLYDTLIPFCRSIAITFDGNGFRPSTRVYPFFDKKGASVYTSPKSATYTTGTAGTLNEPLVTTTAGKIEGTFTIPDPKIDGNPKWDTGEILFELTSSSTNATEPAPSTMGQVIWTSTGILETHQETVISTRNAELNTREVNQEVSSFQTTSRDERIPVRRMDPLAQTFIVRKIGGAFLTSVDIFFCTKDDNFPLWVEIRNVVNGYPGPRVLPFSRKTIYPENVTTSADASVATNIKFNSPVYVPTDTEYTITLNTAAQMNQWSAWICKLGQTDVGGGRTVSVQPHVGVLFRSHNSSAWEMGSLEDMKFTVYRAEFDISQSGIVTLQNKELPTRLLTSNPLIFKHADSEIRVKHKDHDMYATSNYVTITGVSSEIATTLTSTITDSETSSIPLAALDNFANTTGVYSRIAADSNKWFIKIDDEVIEYTGTSATSGAGNINAGIVRARGGTVAAAHQSGATVELYQLYQIPLFLINAAHTSIGNVGGISGGNELDYYTINIANSPNSIAAIGAAGAILQTTSGSVQGGGSAVYATENEQMDTVQTMIGSLELPETTITPKIRPVTATSVSGGQTSFTQISSSAALSIPLNDNYHFDVPYMAASGVNETAQAGIAAKSVYLPLTLTSTNSSISPVIDTQRMGVLAVANRMNKVTGAGAYTVDTTYTDYKASTQPEGDNNTAVYMTREAILDTPATALKVFFAGHREDSSEINVMYKILRTDDATDFDEIGWTYFNTTGTTDTTTRTSLNISDYQQYMYSAGVKDDGTGTSLDSFIAFSIKIVMQGTNTAKPPRIKDLRAIALST